MQQTKRTFEWNDDTLHVNKDGMTEGQAWCGSYEHEGQQYDVSASVTSYTFEQYGEQRTNHVPHVVVTTIEGSIVAEPHCHDSRHPEKAIQNAKGTAEYVVQHLEQFV